MGRKKNYKIGNNNAVTRKISKDLDREIKRKQRELKSNCSEPKKVSYLYASKMLSNKKGQVNQFGLIIGFILLFGFILFLFLFMNIGLKQVIGENIITPTINTTLNATYSMLDAGTITTINDLDAWYNGDWVNFDLFFLVLCIIFILELFYTASQIKITNIFSFFGLITIGNLIFLGILTFVGQIRDWLILNLYTNLFDLTSVYTPIINIFLENLNIISFLLFSLTILISILDWKQVYQKVTGFGSNEVVEE